MEPFDIEAIRKDFPNLNIDIHGQRIAYLDNAATTFKPQRVIDTITTHYTAETSNVHRGVHFLSEHATAHYEHARDRVKEFINAKRDVEIIFTRGTTESINVVSQSYGREFLKAGDEIIISEMEHHSNIVPWQMLCEEKGCVLKIVPINDAGEFIFEEYTKLLSDKTKLVSVVYISNSLGTINPVKKIIDAAHNVGAKVLIDGAQAVSYFRVDVQALDCDFFVFSGHKLFGPTGIGVLYGKEALLNSMPPVQGGGDMIASVTFEKTTYNSLPHKFEAGTPNIAGVLGLGQAVQYLEDLGLEKTLEHKKDLLKYTTQTLTKIPGLRIIGTAEEKASVVSFVMEDIHPHDIGTLVDEESVAIRTGHHCTQPVMKRFKVPATARASISIYNTKDEIDRLAAALIKAQAVFQ